MRVLFLLGAVGLVGAGVVLEVYVQEGTLLAAFTTLRTWLALSVSLPLGLLILLPLLGAAVPSFVRWRRSGPRLDDYTRDKIGGVIWEWEWKSGNPYPEPLSPICPECMRSMVVRSERSEEGRAQAADVAECPCGYRQTIGQGGNYIDDLFKVEVDRRVRIGYWREALEHWSSRGRPLPPAEEVQ